MPVPLSLLCLPCAGASATMYLRWRRHLPAWIRVMPVELPGRGSRLAEPFVEGFDALVALLCEEQIPAMQGEFAIFGHSMGALLAYGMTRHLLLQGRCAPRVLLVSGSSAPSRRDPNRFAGKNDDEALIADLRRQGGTPEEVFQSSELARITLDVLGADYRVCESFVYSGAQPLPLSIHVFGGRDDDIEPDRLQAWDQEAGKRFTLDWFDGGHFFIRQHEAKVLTTLARRLGESSFGGLHATHAYA